MYCNFVLPFVLLFRTTQDAILLVFVINAFPLFAALRTEIKVAMEIEYQHLVIVFHLCVLRVRSQSGEVFGLDAVAFDGERIHQHYENPPFILIISDTDRCEGDGIIKIEMHFLPDVYVTCDACDGKRYNRETLEVKYKGKNIFDILDMTIDDANVFFKNQPRIMKYLEVLKAVGLGYMKLGQPATELSGGEAQRVKLATELAKRATGRTLYILDEPTTGLHFYDVHKLIDILQKLTDNGNTVVVIEHNLDVIKSADYIIDLGPDSGDNGGTVIAKGTPRELAKVKNSYTGEYLKRFLDK